MPVVAYKVDICVKSDETRPDKCSQECPAIKDYDVTRGTCWQEVYDGASGWDIGLDNIYADELRNDVKKLSHGTCSDITVTAKDQCNHPAVWNEDALKKTGGVGRRGWDDLGLLEDPNPTPFAKRRWFQKTLYPNTVKSDAETVDGGKKMKANEKYYFRVRAMNNGPFGAYRSGWLSSGEVSTRSRREKCVMWSDTIEVTTKAPSAPGPIRQAQIRMIEDKTTGGSIGMEWDNPDDTGGDKITGWNLFKVNTPVIILSDGSDQIQEGSTRWSIDPVTGQRGCKHDDGRDLCDRTLLWTCRETTCFPKGTEPTRNVQLSCGSTLKEGMCDDKLESNKEYYFQVQPINLASAEKANGGFGPRVGALTKTTQPTWPLAPPRGPDIIKTDTTGGAIALEFSEPADTGGGTILGYILTMRCVPPSSDSTIENGCPGERAMRIRTGEKWVSNNIPSNEDTIAGLASDPWPADATTTHINKMRITHFPIGLMVYDVNEQGQEDRSFKYLYLEQKIYVIETQCTFALVRGFTGVFTDGVSNDIPQELNLLEDLQLLKKGSIVLVRPLDAQSTCSRGGKYVIKNDVNSGDTSIAVVGACVAQPIDDKCTLQVFDTCVGRCNSPGNYGRALRANTQYIFSVAAVNNVLCNGAWKFPEYAALEDNYDTNGNGLTTKGQLRDKCLELLGITAWRDASIGEGFEKDFMTEFRSPEISITTTALTIPEKPYKSVQLVGKTGGKFRIQLTEPLDTGGIAIDRYYVRLRKRRTCREPTSAVCPDGFPNLFEEPDGSICKNTNGEKVCPNDCSSAPKTPAVYGHMTRVGNNTNAGTQGEAQCYLDSQTERLAPTFVNSTRNRELAVQCCSIDGTTATRFKNSSCMQAVTYEQALKQCDDEGQRLCTDAEVQADIGAGKGCDHDVRHVLTNTTCTATPVQLNTVIKTTQ